MPLNLPSNPSNGQTYEDSVTGFTYQYDGSAWNGVAPPVSVLNNISQEKFRRIESKVLEIFLKRFLIGKFRSTSYQNII